MTQTTLTAADTWSKWTQSATPAFEGIACASDPSIVELDGRLLMYHTSVDLTAFRTVIAVAVSDDGGETWAYPDTPSETPGSVLDGIIGSWEERLEGPFAVVRDGKVLLYYSGYRDEGDPFVGFPAALTLATSTDGIHFERVSEEPLLPPTPGGYDNDAVYSPCVIDVDGTLHMLYAAHCYTRCDREGGGGVRILGATSTDGVTWTKRDEPVLEALPDVEWATEGVAEPGINLGPDGRFYLWFTGLGPNDSRRIGVASGPTPFGPWDVNPEPVVVAAPGTFAEHQVLAPDVRIEGDRVRMWHLGCDSKERIMIGYAESSWPLRLG